MQETITVRILSGGRQAREVNRFTKLNWKEYYSEMSPIIGKKATIEMYHRNNANFEEAESKLRTWEIEAIREYNEYDNSHVDITKDDFDFQLTEGAIYKAEIINGKIIIL